MYIIQEGGFFSAQDADSLPTYDSPAKREGAYYVWSYDSLKTILKNKIPGKDNITYFDLVCRQFSVQKEGNVERAQVCFAIETIFATRNIYKSL